MYLAEELIAPGGPSAPVWAFLSSITLALIAMIPMLISTRRKAGNAQSEASAARQSSNEVATNTESLSNGFAGTVDSKLNRILGKQDAMEKAFREHLEWHLDRKE